MSKYDNLIGTVIGGFKVERILTTKEGREQGYSGMAIELCCEKCKQVFVTNRQYFIMRQSTRCPNCSEIKKTCTSSKKLAPLRAPYAKEVFNLDNKIVTRKVVDIKNNVYVFKTPVKYSSSIEDLLLAGTFVAYKLVGNTYKTFNNIPMHKKEILKFSNIGTFVLKSEKEQKEFGDFMQDKISDRPPLMATIDEQVKSKSSKQTESVIKSDVTAAESSATALLELKLLLKSMENMLEEKDNELCTRKKNQRLAMDRVIHLEAKLDLVYDAVANAYTELKEKTTKGSRDVSFGWLVYNKFKDAIY